MSNFVFALGFLCKFEVGRILFLCCANLPRFDARIWPYFHVKIHKSPVFNTQIGMSTAVITVTSLSKCLRVLSDLFFKCFPYLSRVTRPRWGCRCYSQAESKEVRPLDTS